MHNSKSNGAYAVDKHSEYFVRFIFIVLFFIVLLMSKEYSACSKKHGAN